MGLRDAAVLRPHAAFSPTARSPPAPPDGGTISEAPLAAEQAPFPYRSLLTLATHRVVALILLAACVAAGLLASRARSTAPLPEARRAETAATGLLASRAHSPAQLPGAWGAPETAGEEGKTENGVGNRNSGTQKSKIWKSKIRNSEIRNSEIRQSELEAWEQQRRVYRDEVTRAVARGERYYLLSSATDRCVGQSHWSWSLRCAAAEAKALRRALVLVTDRCLHQAHSRTGRDEHGHVGLYYNLTTMMSRQPIVFLEHFQARFGSWEWEVIPMRKFPIGPRTGELAVWRNVFLVVRAPQEGQYGFMLCDKEHKQNQDNITFDPDFLFPNDAFTRLAHAMADAMGGPHRFDYIHVRRGDKLDARRWPHLDRDTRPEALLQKLPSLVPPNTTLYIATNEPHPHFFDPLKAAYSVYIQEDFESLWAKGSAWEAEMREVAASVGVAVGERVEFGSEMQVLVDYALKKLARRTVETFNDLTDDPKDGVVGP